MIYIQWLDREINGVYVNTDETKHIRMVWHRKYI